MKKLLCRVADYDHTALVFCFAVPFPSWFSISALSCGTPQVFVELEMFCSHQNVFKLFVFFLQLFITPAGHKMYEGDQVAGYHQPGAPVGRMVFDGKRMRKPIQRKTVDYNSTVIKYLEYRKYQRRFRDITQLQPHSDYIKDVSIHDQVARSCALCHRQRNLHVQKRTHTHAHTLMPWLRERSSPCAVTPTRYWHQQWQCQ